MGCLQIRVSYVQAQLVMHNCASLSDYSHNTYNSVLIKECIAI